MWTNRIVMHVATPAAMLALAIALFGCEQSRNQSGLTIQPGEQEFSFDGQTATLTATGGLRSLSLPLEWAVSEPGIGDIIAHQGVTAVYQRRSAGVNIVTVTDQYGAEGIATMSSPNTGTSGGGGYSLVLAANPSATLATGVHTVSITAINGTAPYQWSVGDAAKGAVSSETGNTVTYTSTATGDNTVICVDVNGAQGTITITQE